MKTVDVDLSSLIFHYLKVQGHFALQQVFYGLAWFGCTSVASCGYYSWAFSRIMARNDVITKKKQYTYGSKVLNDLLVT